MMVQWGWNNKINRLECVRGERKQKVTIIQSFITIPLCWRLRDDENFSLSFTRDFINELLFIRSTHTHFMHKISNLKREKRRFEINHFRVNFYEVWSLSWEKNKYLSLRMRLKAVLLSSAELNCLRWVYG
jgi:hypothetical protein